MMNASSTRSMHRDRDVIRWNIIVSFLKWIVTWYTIHFFLRSPKRKLSFTLPDISHIFFSLSLLYFLLPPGLNSLSSCQHLFSWWKWFFPFLTLCFPWACRSTPLGPEFPGHLGRRAWTGGCKSPESEEHITIRVHQGGIIHELAWKFSGMTDIGKNLLSISFSRK